MTCELTELATAGDGTIFGKVGSAKGGMWAGGAGHELAHAPKGGPHVVLCCVWRSAGNTDVTKAAVGKWVLVFGADVGVVVERIVAGACNRSPCLCDACSVAGRCCLCVDDAFAACAMLAGVRDALQRCATPPATTRRTPPTACEKWGVGRRKCGNRCHGVGCGVRLERHPTEAAEADHQPDDARV